MPSGEDVSYIIRQKAQNSLQDAVRLLQDKLNQTATQLGIMVDQCQRTLGYDEFMVLLNAAKALIVAAIRECIQRFLD